MAEYFHSLFADAATIGRVRFEALQLRVRSRLTDHASAESGAAY